MYKDIEFVSARNNGRSPLAEVVGRNVAGVLGLGREVKISSSGTLVYLSKPTEDLGSYNDLASYISPFVEKAVRNGILTPSHIELVKRDPARVLILLQSQEAEFRNDYLLQVMGLTTFLHSHTQTIPRTNAELILTMDSITEDRVLKFYEKAVREHDVPRMPRIQGLSSFAGTDYPLTDTFPNDEESYVSLATRVDISARAAMLNALDR